MHSLSFGYNTDDTIQGITDNVVSSNTESLGYDANRRLTAVTRTGDNAAYAWDVADNRTSSTRNGTTVIPSTPFPACLVKCDAYRAPGSG